MYNNPEKEADERNLVFLSRVDANSLNLKSFLSRQSFSMKDQNNLCLHDA